MTKRVAETQITKDDVEYGDARVEPESSETRNRASDDVLATRKIVSVKRSSEPKLESSHSTPVPTATAANEPKSLFSGLVTSTVSTSAPSKETEVVSSSSLFSGLSSLASNEPKSSSESDKGLFSSLFAPLDTSSGFGSFTFSAPTGETAFPSFGTTKSGETPEDAGGQESSEAEEEPEEEQPTIQTVIDHGEDEEQVFQSDCKLYKLQKVEKDNDSVGGNNIVKKWVEKGIGFVRIIKTKDSSSSYRVVVRMKGVFRLMLNTALIPSICKAETVGNKSLKFTAVDEDGSNIADFRLNLITEDNQAAFVSHLPKELLMVNESG